jgi:hypothetical protein
LRAIRGIPGSLISKSPPVNSAKSNVPFSQIIYIKDGIEVIVNPLDDIDGGTAFPTDDPQGDFDNFVQDNPPNPSSP